MLMSKPERYSRSLDTFLNQVHRHSMPQPVDSNTVLFKRWTHLASRTTMFVQDVLNSVDGESPSSSVGKKDVSVASLRLSEPGFEHGASDLGQRRAPLSPALADNPQVRPDAEHEILAFESRHLRKTKAGLRCCEDKGVVAPPGPGTPVWSLE
jgi:hypothetical protein